MSSLERITRNFRMFYDDIDAQINHLRRSDSFLTNDSNKSNNVNSQNVDDVIESAKKFDTEVKSLVEKNRPKRDVKRRARPESIKSTIPPIWNERKLNEYIETIIDDIFDEDRALIENVPPIEATKSILKESKNAKNVARKQRNVGTNVKFLIHSKDESVNVAREKGKNKKVQTIKSNDLDIERDTTSGILFPHRTERVVNHDGSVDVKLAKSFKLPESVGINLPPDKLAFSPITVTSTNGQKTKDSDDIVNVRACNLATDAHTRLSKFHCPVLSIRGTSGCKTQTIYQFEISPENVTKQSTTISSSDNAKLYEFTYIDPAKNVNDAPLAADQSTNEIPSQHSTAPAIETKDHSYLLDVRDLNKIFNDYGVHSQDGKIHVVLESAAKSSGNKKKRTRKHFKKLPPAPAKSVAKNSIKMKSNKKEESSSDDDDEQLRKVLNLRRERRERSTALNMSDSSSDKLVHKESKNNVEQSVSKNFESIYELIENTFAASSSNSAQQRAEENEKKIEEGVDEIKQIIRMAEESIKKAGLILKKYERESQKEDASEPQSCVKHIDKSEHVTACQYQTADQNVGTDDDPFIQCQNYQTFTRGLQEALVKTADMCVQTTDDKVVQTDDNYNWKSQYYFGSVYEKYSNFNHTNFNKSPATNKAQKLDSKEPLYLSAPSMAFNSSSPIPFNPIYSNDEKIMEIANKFLRSVEKERQMEASAVASDSSSNDFSNLSKLLKDTRINEDSSLASTIDSRELNTPVLDIPGGSSNVPNNNNNNNNDNDNTPLNLAHDIVDDSLKPSNTDNLAELSEGEILSLGEIRFSSDSESDDSSSLNF